MSRPSADWEELDLIRGLAAVIMVFNHAAARWWGGGTTDGFAEVMFDIGGYAPVLFFATTGIGYGIQSEHKGRTGGHRFGFARKVAILLIADSFLWFFPDQPIGNDFLGFIALTMLVLELLRGSRRGWWLALLGGIAIAGLRFVVVPKLVQPPATPQDVTILHWLTGLGSPPGFSYPPLPWLAYGLFGFTAGALAQRHRTAVLARRGALAATLVVTATVGFAFVAWRVQQGSNLARWGSVNGTFFVSGFAALALATGLAFTMARFGGGPTWLRLRGLSSLALVPIHYGVVALVAVSSLGAMGGLPGQVMLMTLAVALSLLGAHAWPSVVRRLDSPTGWWILVVTTVGVFVFRMTFETVAQHDTSKVLAPLALCALLVVKRRRS